MNMNRRLLSAALIGLLAICNRSVADDIPAAPGEDVYKRQVDWLTSQGFTITRRDPNHLAVFARGKVSLIEKALQVTFARVTLGGAEYTSAVTAPSVPANLAPLVVGINGLQPHIRAHTHSVIRPASLTGTGEPYLPSQIAQAYSASGLYSACLLYTSRCV